MLFTLKIAKLCLSVLTLLGQEYNSAEIVLINNAHLDTPFLSIIYVFLSLAVFP